MQILRQFRSLPRFGKLVMCRRLYRLHPRLCHLLGSGRFSSLQFRVALLLSTAQHGVVLLIDALDMDFRTVKLRRDPECPLCGDNPTVTELIDYDAFCGFPSTA